MAFSLHLNKSYVCQSELWTFKVYWNSLMLTSNVLVEQGAETQKLGEA